MRLSRPATPMLDLRACHPTALRQAQCERSGGNAPVAAVSPMEALERLGTCSNLRLRGLVIQPHFDRLSANGREAMRLSRPFQQVERRGACRGRLCSICGLVIQSALRQAQCERSGGKAPGAAVTPRDEMRALALLKRLSAALSSSNALRRQGRCERPGCEKLTGNWLACTVLSW